MVLEPPVELQSPLSQQSEESEQVGTRVAGFYLSLGPTQLRLLLTSEEFTTQVRLAAATRAWKSRLGDLGGQSARCL